jgi:protein-tyrosine phosphatase
MVPEINTTRLNNVSLIRTGSDSVKLSWKIRDKSQRVAVFLGESPDEIDRDCPAAMVKGKTDADISGLDPGTRYYFVVAPEHGSQSIISERRVQLEGSVNFRDLGGYPTVDGRRVKWGLVFRSDNLGRLTDRDVTYVQKMGIQLVCDFRTPAEVQKLPDLFPQGGHCRSLQLPIRHGEYDPANTFERIKKGDIEWLTEEFMVNGYIKNIENFAPVWSTFFNHLSDRCNRPLVFHCTGGKDRAGVCAALVLLALGVPEETVIQDHGLSNIYIAGVLERIYAQIRSLGVDPEKVAPYFTAPKSAIVALLKYILTTYGSAADYLNNKAGIGPKVLNRLKGDFLE